MQYHPDPWSLKGVSLGRVAGVKKNLCQITKRTTAVVTPRGGTGWQWSFFLLFFSLPSCFFAITSSISSFSSTFSSSAPSFFIFFFFYYLLLSLLFVLLLIWLRILHLLISKYSSTKYSSTSSDTHFYFFTTHSSFTTYYYCSEESVLLLILLRLILWLLLFLLLFLLILILPLLFLLLLEYLRQTWTFHLPFWQCPLPLAPDGALTFWQQCSCHTTLSCSASEVTRILRLPELLYFQCWAFWTSEELLRGHITMKNCVQP